MNRALSIVAVMAVLSMASCALEDQSTRDRLAATQAPPGLMGSTNNRRPNIVILFADDLGYGDLGIQGDKQALTPNVDALAAQGVRLVDYYANHPVCSPSRAALLTGVYQQRMGFEFNSGSPQNTSPEFGIDLNVPTLAERLKKVGYVTGAFGKWHVGFRPETMPTARGFDEYYGFLSGAHAYTRARAGQQRSGGMLRGTEPVPMPLHTTEAFGEEAVKFIRANRDRPFFLYLSFNAVHAPMDTTEAYLARFSGIQDKTRRTHLAMLAAMDDAIGRVMTTLKDEGLDKETLVFFASDNGGPTQQTTSSNGPLNGVKGLVLEGGIRVPAIVRWKDRLPEGKISQTLAMGFDVTATALAAADALPATGLDGVDLMPYLSGDKTGDAHKALFWRAGAQGAMRAGDWKLIKNGDKWHLFNLVSDIGERTDLATIESERFAQLQADWKAWSGEMIEPRWVRNERAGGDGRAGRASLEAIETFIRGEPAHVSNDD